MYLNASTDKLEIVLGGTVATNQLNWNVSYQDITSTGMTLPQSAGAGNTNNATAVDIVAAPAASTTRQVTHINVFNADTATATVTIQKDVSGTNYVLISYAVTSGDTLMWSREDGWRLAKAGGSGTTLSIGTINSQTKSADGAVISGSSLVMQTADATFPGVISTGTQIFAGAKTFSSAPTFSTMTNQSILFAGASGVLTQDNTNLKWDGTNVILGNNKGIVLQSTGTNRNALITPINLTDNFAGTNIYPSTGTNVSSSVFIVPRGTGLVSTNRAQISVLNTDFVVDNINYELLSLRASGANFAISSGGVGTGTTRPILFSAGFISATPANTNQFWLYTSGNIGLNTSSDAGFRLDVNGTTRLQGDVTISDTRNLILATGTGTKIGTATTQKLGFWNAAPIVQPTTAVASATRVGGGGTTVTDTDTFDGYTIAQVVKALRNTGILA